MGDFGYQSRITLHHDRTGVVFELPMKLVGHCLDLNELSSMLDQRCCHVPVACRFTGKVMQGFALDAVYTQQCGHESVGV